MNNDGEIVYIYIPMMIILKTVTNENVVPNTKENNFILSKKFFILIFINSFNNYIIINYKVISRKCVFYVCNFTINIHHNYI